MSVDRDFLYKADTIITIFNYFKNSSVGGKVKRSLREISENVGFSPATVHRAIQKLHNMGVIDILESDTPNEPDTYVILKEVLISNEEIIRAIDEYENLLKNFVGILKIIKTGIIEKKEDNNNVLFNEFKDSVININDIGDNKYIFVIDGSKMSTDLKKIFGLL
ncbi:MAG: winged helix-turn-helix transcriptional regulator [Thermovenabulum sp.]|uniref:winged helix-turn-helix transcriptional regulator n=1 Tax=Thermovenabulum sp. TaxID=3100335 RepID=UPI003C7A8A92